MRRTFVVPYQLLPSLCYSPNRSVSGAEGFASNGYGAHSPGGYSPLACFVAEVVLTAFFLIIIIMGSTDSRSPQGFAPIAIGLGLTLIHFVGIPVTNLAVNPARSAGPALFVRGWAVAQLWMFWVAPIIGGALGGATYHALFGEQTAVLATPRSISFDPAGKVPVQP